jgi:hypothetical protein
MRGGEADHLASRQGRVEQPTPPGHRLKPPKLRQRDVEERQRHLLLLLLLLLRRRRRRRRRRRPRRIYPGPARFLRRPPLRVEIIGGRRRPAAADQARRPGTAAALYAHARTADGARKAETGPNNDLLQSMIYSHLKAARFDLWRPHYERAHARSQTQKHTTHAHTL